MADGRLFHFPRADEATVWWVSAAALGLMAGAVVAETWRQRREGRRRRAEAWQAARGIAQEKELSRAEWTLLEELVQHWAADPLGIVTSRAQFDRVVAQDLRDARGRISQADYELRGVLLRDLRTRLALDYIPFGQRIDSTRELYREQLLWAAEDAETSDWHRMSVVAVDEAHLRLHPGARDFSTKLALGQHLTFRMWREEDARYSFSAEVARVDPEQGIVLLHHTDSMERLQARAHFRLPLELAVEIEILEPQRAAGRARGRLVNLSGGGFAALLQQPIPPEAAVQLHLALEGHETLVAAARVVDGIMLSGNTHLVRGCFTGSSEDTRERIAQFIFRRQQQHQLAAADG